MPHALAYAEELIANGRFEHSPGPSRPNQGRESVGGNSQRIFIRADGERLDRRETIFPGRRFPDVSTTGNWQDVGHYTQIIWRNTTRIGCGLASNAQRDVLVCRYSPPGNFIGQRVF